LEFTDLDQCNVVYKTAQIQLHKFNFTYKILRNMKQTEIQWTFNAVNRFNTMCQWVLSWQQSI